MVGHPLVLSCMRGLVVTTWPFRLLSGSLRSLEWVTESMDNIVNGFSNSLALLESKTVEVVGVEELAHLRVE
ncbi:hypothetical protein ACE6H2_016242 [Prunus campanulata]